MQSVSFTGREEVEAATKPIILVNCVEYYDVLLQMESLTALKAGDVISTIYWMLDITNDAEGVDYTKAKTDLNLGERAVIGTVTARARQLVAYTALCAMMGYVKELTTQNMDAGFKRWRAGLASQTLPDLLTDALKKEIWNRILEVRTELYASGHCRSVVLSRYLSARSRTDMFPPTDRAVLSQLHLIYENAYLKSVIAMHDFIISGNPALVLPNIRKEAIIFKRVFEDITSKEGVGFSVCRLLDNSKCPDLNHAAYPNLYAVTLKWARKSKRVQKNYLGSKSITDKATDMELARKLMFAEGTRRIPSINEEEREWLRSVGCHFDTEELEKAMQGGPSRKRRAALSETDTTSESESEEEEEGTRKQKKRGRRAH